MEIESFHYGTIQFRIPVQEPRYQFKASKIYIQLHCNIINHVVNVIGTYEYSRSEETKIQSRVYLMNEAVGRDLVTVLKNWEVPESYHESIVRDVVEEVSQPHVYSRATVSDCLLRVDITFNKYYSPNLDALEQWLLGREYNLEEESGENDDDGMVPASESAIKALVSRKTKREDEKEESSSCPICMEEFSVGSEAASLPCSHMFHPECILQWLRKSHYCPICRFKLPVQDSL